MPAANINLVGILNVTPDSFSDGGKYFDSQTAVAKGVEMFSSGANLVDVGGDSTRPSSACVGAEAEWARIEKPVKALSKLGRISVDTHHAAVADKALQAGAEIINDVSAGYDPDMFGVVSDHRAKIILMHSRCEFPHMFGEEKHGDIIENICTFFAPRIEKALANGVGQSCIILDPGMGGFISTKPARSIELIERFSELESLGFPLMIGISRKGFLKKADELAIEERDELSIELARKVIGALSKSVCLYVRAHDVVMHKALLCR